MLPWVARMQETHITVKELAPIVLAAAVWGHNWHGKVVLAQLRCGGHCILGGLQERRRHATEKMPGISRGKDGVHHLGYTHSRGQKSGS